MLLNHPNKTDVHSYVRKQAELSFIRGERPNENPYPPDARSHLLWAYYYGYIAMGVLLKQIIITEDLIKAVKTEARISEQEYRDALADIAKKRRMSPYNLLAPDEKTKRKFILEAKELALSFLSGKAHAIANRKSKEDIENLIFKLEAIQ